MLVKCSSSFFLNNNSLFSLLDKEIEKHEDAIKNWLQKEVMVCKIIYSTVDQSTFYQVKGELTAADVWKKLTLIHGDKGAMYESDLLAQLQNACYIENGKINIYICTSLSLTPTFKPLFTTLATSAHTSGKPTTSQDLIWHLTKEANSAAIKNNINCQHEAMVAAHAKA
ncbi:hypothetical protein C0995_010548 [Termitomyces sp. Mi166|nr:hypothetical protein C0995_010548 [Termitomyces sp. Mi166\